MQSDSNLSTVSKIAEKLARSAGEIIKQNLQIGIEREWKSDHTPVTAIDKQINQLVIDKIHKEFPTHSILAEEGSDLTRSSELIWVCDPLDGTFPFVHGIPVSTFTLALVQDGEPIFGLIYDPFMDRMFIAEKGKGAHLNGTRIFTTSTTSFNKTSIGAVFWKGNMDIFTPMLSKLTDQGVQVVHLASISYMDAMVACGAFVATIFPGLSAHDSAAAKIIIEEAGGIFTSLTGEVDRYDRPVHGHLACANQGIYDQIQSLLR